MPIYSPLPLQVKQKASDQTVTSNTTLQNDTDLVFTLAANASYYFKIIAGVNFANTTMGYKFDLTAPSSPTAFFASFVAQCANGTDGVQLQASLAPAGFNASGSLPAAGNYNFVLTGFIANGANAGDLQFKFAQATSNASAVTIKQGSVLIIQQVA